MADVDVLATTIGKRGPDDNGKRWSAFCMECGWSVLVKWKGGHRLAVQLAQAHVCSFDDLERD